MVRRSLLVAMAVAVAVLAVEGSNLWAQKTKGKTQPALTKYLMRGIAGPNCGAVGKALKEAPTDDKGWDTLACNAALLNELSYVLMSDGRCPDGVWAGAAKELRAGSAAVLEAADKKDLAAAQASFKQLTGSCKTCHDAHKGK